jgi:hypothetical protein
MKNSMKGALLAATVAGLFGCVKKDTKAASTETGAMTATTDKVHCLGVNECKGKGACGAADGSHSCAGKNECKSKGWIEITGAECTEKGGTVAAK